MSETEASPIPEPDTPASWVEETPAPAPDEGQPAAEEVAAGDEPSNADRLRGLFSSALHDVLTEILDRLDKAGL